ncbi:MAG: NAD-dependent epimerase/dehydratase family protein [Acidobacteria bacterium]|nr:NAD-dependent epimerase/dehydratase family protein [Acidobacteriota bacterium]
MRSPRPVLVTGASGFIGWHVVRELLRVGRTVRVLARPTADVRHLRERNVEIFVGDVRNCDSLQEPVKDIDAVIHLAGVMQAASEEDHRRTHVDGTMNLLDAMERHARSVRRLVYVSSLAVTGAAPRGQSLGEDATPVPVGAYGRTKLEAEAAVLERADRFPVTIFRPPLVYGPRDRSLLPYFQAIRAGLVILPGGGDQPISIVHAVDLAAAIVRATERDHASGAVFHVTDGPARRLRDLAEAVRLAQGTPAITFSVSRDTLGAAQRLGRLCLRWLPGMPAWLHPDSLDLLLATGWNCSDARVRRDLDWAPRVPLVEGLAGTVDWYRDAGWLLRPWGGPLNRRELRPSKAPPDSSRMGKGGSS